MALTVARWPMAPRTIPKTAALLLLLLFLLLLLSLSSKEEGPAAASFGETEISNISKHPTFPYGNIEGPGDTSKDNGFSLWLG